MDFRKNLQKALTLPIWLTIASSISAEAHGTTLLSVVKVCSTENGRPNYPLIDSAETAKKIFLAKEQKINPNADIAAFPDVKAEEHEFSWTVYRWNFIKKVRRGQLSIQIDQCSGTISNINIDARSRPIIEE